MEKIGKVELDNTCYPGRDLYSDGEVEDQLLEIARNYGEEDYNRIIAETSSWPVMYHFSNKEIVFWKSELDVEPLQERWPVKQKVCIVLNFLKKEVTLMLTEIKLVTM